MVTIKNIHWYSQITKHDLPQVGGKNASLGEMIHHLSRLGLNIPDGFATSADAYQRFLQQAGLTEEINTLLSKLDVSDLPALAAAGSHIRAKIMAAEFSEDFVADVKQAWQQLTANMGGEDCPLAVRSSATAEDLPNASFAGQQETLLNVRGYERLLMAIKTVFASLFTDRAIAYRVHQQFKHEDVALSVGVQLMIRSDLSSSGVMFTLDTESGFRDVVFITSAYGLGETVVQGSVNPDEFYVYKLNLHTPKPAILRRVLGSKKIKMIFSDTENAEHYTKIVDVPENQAQQFSLHDDEVSELAKAALLIEQHYQQPMDIEWAKDGVSGKIYIVQARPETVKSRESLQSIQQYEILQRSEVIVTGRSVGQRVSHGVARIVNSIEQINSVQPGDVLVTDMTDPNWEPVMKRAKAIVTNRGGRTCHAAIIARELGMPAIVGCNDATQKIKNGEMITVSCAEGDTGYIYRGKIAYSCKETKLDNMPTLPVKIMLNVAQPERAFSFAAIPNDGVGLARMEFIINNSIGIHPQALLELSKLPQALQTEVLTKTAAYASPREFFIRTLAEGIATIAAAFYPKQVIVRLSDFKTNEYASLLGGEHFEPEEENPMLGFRGASRYISSSFRDCFIMECEALKRARETMGFHNIAVMVPFVRTLTEAKQVITLLSEQGLQSGKHDLQLIMMCEIPSNVLLAQQFLEYFDGFSIGSNDLTQLTLGVDRDSGLMASQFDERDAAVKMLLAQVIKQCRSEHKYIGICGQGPSDHPDFAKWLVEQGISSLSLNPDSVLTTIDSFRQ